MLIRFLPLLAVPAAVLAACAKGGNEETPPSGLRITANHHLVGVIGDVDFARFPVSPDEVGPLEGTFDTTDQGLYSIRTAGSLLIEDDYSLANDGELTVFQTRVQASTLVYRGGYGVDGDTGNFFFTDRVTDNVGLYFGLRAITGTPDLAEIAGSWHVVSMHVLYATTTTSASVHEVGRAFVGRAAIDATGALAGQGRESTSPMAQLPITGDVRAFQGGAFDVDIWYGSAMRNFDGGGNGSLVLLAGLDEVRDRASGLCALMRARTGSMDPAALAGIYDIGVWILQVDPSDPGFDSALGSLELTATGDFEILVRNNLGDDLRYTGDWNAGDDGTLNLVVSSPAEQWHGAFDQGYKTIVLVDNETSPAIGSPFAPLRFFFAVRRAPAPPV